MIAKSNFNEHNELSDLDFLMHFMNVVQGYPANDCTPAYFSSSNFGNGTWLSGQLGSVANSRYQFYQGYVAWANGAGVAIAENTNWLQYIPSYTWLIAIPVTAIVGVILVWNAWGKSIFDKYVPKGENSSTRI